MVATTNFALETVDANQTNKEVPVNNDMTQLDTLLGDSIAIVTTAGGTIVIPVAGPLDAKEQFQRNARFELTGSPAGAFTMEFEEVARFFILKNSSGQTATIRCTATPGTTVALDSGEEVAMYCDGATGQNMSLVAASVAALQGPFDIGAFIPGGTTDNQLMLQYTFARSVDFPDEFAGSVGSVGTNPASAVALDVQKNTVSIGTISITTGGVVSFVTAGGGTESFVSGDELQMVNQATADTTLEDVAITFKGTRL